MFDDFDFSCLDSNDFKEDAVREEIIAPIVKRLGFRPTGDTQVQRSKNLVHPYVMIGAKKHKINIVPDYTLYIKSIPKAIIEAKAPSEEIYRSLNVEQAYSYAIHPDIRCEIYVLCNGRELIVYSCSKWEPLLRINIELIDQNWSLVEKVLSPSHLIRPELRDFIPDCGMAMAKLLGYSSSIHLFIAHQIEYLAMVELDRLYIANSGASFSDEGEFLVTFDISQELYEQMLYSLPQEASSLIRSQMSRAPYAVRLNGMITATFAGILGNLTESNETGEEFIPIVVTDIEDVRWHPDYIPSKLDISENNPFLSDTPPSGSFE